MTAEKSEKRATGNSTCRSSDERRQNGLRLKYISNRQGIPDVLTKLVQLAQMTNIGEKL